MATVMDTAPPTSPTTQTKKKKKDVVQEEPSIIKYKNDLKKRIGGDAEFEMVMNCYIDNILQDNILVSFFPMIQKDTRTFVEQQHRVIDLVLAEDPEHADIRMAIYFQDLEGFRQDHLLKFCEHFCTALRENWGDESIIRDVTECFQTYLSVFDKHASTRHISKEYFEHAAATADGKRKQKQEQKDNDGDTNMLLSPAPQQPKKAAVQHTPFGIKALKEKITNRLRSPRSPKPTIGGSAAAAKSPSSSPKQGEEKEDAKKSMVDVIAPVDL